MADRQTAPHDGMSTHNTSRRLLLAILPVCGLASQALADKSPYDWAFIRLDYARQEKVGQLHGFCDRTHALARKAAKDELVLACFDVNLNYCDAMAKGSVPQPLAARVAELREQFNTYYIEKYLAFYDILFVDLRGHAFYTIRKECDFDQDVLTHNAADSALVRCLKARPHEEVFVDFHNYGPSSEPAAFFVEPVCRQGVLSGWIVLQCAINKLNTLFAWTDTLGQTGETFLVNQEGFMLTESNFEGSSTILTRHLDDRNVQAKFTERRGHRKVTDYRGHTALTSFEVVEFLGTRWLVVAKVDTHEIITRHYADHRRYFGDRLVKYLSRAPVPPPRDVPPVDAGALIRVDMDEFLKAGDGEQLHTFGIATCTGLLAAYPGRFAYLAHISPKDQVYGSDDTNLVAQMVRKLKTFDIYPCDTRRITFVVVATHLNSLLAITDRLIEEDMLLSQIRVMYNPQAASAAISYDCMRDALEVRWREAGDPTGGSVHSMADSRDLESVTQDVMRLEEQTAAAGVSVRGTSGNRQEEPLARIPP